MSSANSHDYDYWIKLPSWSNREAVLLLHENDPENPIYKSTYFSDKSNPESFTRRKIISAKNIKSGLKNKSGPLASRQDQPE